ncbi:MAG: DRTGG domain-containing protein [Bacteroidota bacterium]
MKLAEIVDKLNLKVFSGKEGLNNEVTNGYISDLLSDVMGHAEAGNAWITLQTHKNVMAIASLKDLSAVILVKGLLPEEDMAAQSNEEGIPVLGTGEEAFTISGKLYSMLQQ